MRIKHKTFRLVGNPHFGAEVLRKDYVLLRSTTHVEREQVAELQYVSKPFQVLSPQRLQECQLLLPPLFVAEKRFQLVPFLLVAAARGHHVLGQPEKMPAHNIATSGRDGLPGRDG